MKLVYYSKTGKVKRFVEKVLNEDNSIVAEDINSYSGGNYVLITSTQGKGEVPKEVLAFLEENGNNMVGVASSGNKAWGLQLFAKSGNIVSMLYKVPLIAKFENQGFPSDVLKFIEGLKTVGLD